MKSNKYILPKQIQLGTYLEGNIKRIRFNPNNPEHIKLFKIFYDIKK